MQLLQTIEHASFILQVMLLSGLVKYRCGYTDCKKIEYKYETVQDKGNRVAR